MVGAAARASQVTFVLDDYPRHAYFVSDDRILLLEDSFKLLSTRSTLAMPPGGHKPPRASMSRMLSSLAGFQVITIGRF